MAGGPARRAAAVVQHGQLAHLKAYVPFVRPALLYDRSWQPRPLLAVILLFLLRAGVAASTGLSSGNLPSLSSSSYMPAPSWSQADNVCHYRLHRGSWMHMQICSLNWANIPRFT
jgi:hypothetical protein